MIVAIGSDIVNEQRIAKVLDRFGDRFINRCFTPSEIQKAQFRSAAQTHIAHYAKRFAAKEACAKALGIGFSHGVFMRDIGVVNAPSGQPNLVLAGGALARLNEIIPAGKTPHLHLTLSDDPPIIAAFVVIEAR